MPTMIGRTFAATVVAVVAAFLPAQSATAAITYAEASVDITGYPTEFHSMSGDAAGAQSSAAHDVPTSTFGSAEAAAYVGNLHAAAVSRGSDPTTIGSNAKASWSDAFKIDATGHSVGETGTFDGSVSVSGSLLAEIQGRSYAVSQVIGNVLISPHTGFNGGVVALQGGGRRALGYDTGDSLTGAQGFSLIFQNVSFTFGQPIDIAMQLVVSASAIIGFDESGSYANAQPNYFSSMLWDGITIVRDASGNSVSGASMRSATSGFDFAANASTVAEPSSVALALLATFTTLLAHRRRRAGSQRADCLT